MKRLTMMAVVLTAGCFVSEDANESFVDCSSDADCAMGESCVRGFCVGGADGGTATCDTVPELCGDGQTCCGGVCVTLGSTANCGACDDACAAGDSCCQGSCVAPSDPACECPACSGSETCCDGTCTDVSEDPNNCGACGTTCGDGQLCCGGGCVPSDANNCGRCGATCGGAEICCGAAGCLDPTSPGSCGTCGNVCIESSCANGVCCGDQAGEMICDGSCVNTLTDDANCGSCGTECGPLEGCMDGDCRVL